MASRRNRLRSHPAPIPSWGYPGSKWNYIPDATGLGWNEPLPARCFGGWVPPEPTNEIEIEWRTLADDGPGPDKGGEAIGGGDGRWKVTARSAVYAGTIEVGDLYDRLGVLRNDALAVADTTVRLPSIRVRLHSFSTNITYSSGAPQAGRHFLLWGVANADGTPTTHINGLLGGSAVLDMDCTPGGGITYEMRNIRHGAWQEDIDIDPYFQSGGGFLLFGESNVAIMRNVHFRNTSSSGWDGAHKNTNEAEHKMHSAFFATDSVLYYCGADPLKHGQYDASAGPWVDVRVLSGPHVGHCLRWASDGMGLNCAVIGRADEGMDAGTGYQTCINLMPAAFFHGENLAVYPSIGNVAGLNSRGGIQHNPRRSSAGYATSPFMLGVEKAKALSPYVKDETEIERWRYQTFAPSGNDLLVDGSDHSAGQLSETASATTVKARFIRSILSGGSGAGYRTLSTDTTANAWDLVLIDMADGKRHALTGTYVTSTGAGAAEFTVSETLNGTYAFPTTMVAVRQNETHPAGAQVWDRMELNEPYYNLRHPLCPWNDAVIPGVTPDGPWAELSWPWAHHKSLHNIYFRPLHNNDAGASCLIEVYGSLAETYLQDQGTTRHPFPPANEGAWPPAPNGLSDGNWAAEGFVAVSNGYDSIYGPDGSGGSGVNNSAIRDHNTTLLSNISSHEDAGLTEAIAGQIRHNTNYSAPAQQAACWWLDDAGAPQRVVMAVQTPVSPLPASTQTTINGAITGDFDDPVRTIVLTSATGATVGKGIHIEMEGALGGWGVLFDEIVAVDGTTVTLRVGATHDIANGARVAIITAAGNPPKPWQTALKLWEKFAEFSMV